MRYSIDLIHEIDTPHGPFEIGIEAEGEVYPSDTGHGKDVNITLFRPYDLETFDVLLDLTRDQRADLEDWVTDRLVEEAEGVNND